MVENNPRTETQKDFLCPTCEVEADRIGLTMSVRPSVSLSVQVFHFLALPYNLFDLESSNFTQILPLVHRRVLYFLRSQGRMKTLFEYRFLTLTQNPFDLGTGNFTQVLPLAHKGLFFFLSRGSKVKTLVFTSLQYKYFESTTEKGEIAHNEQFLLFPQSFLLVWRTFCHFHHI